MTAAAGAGRLHTAYLQPGSSSFTEFLAGVAPELLPAHRGADLEPRQDEVKFEKQKRGRK